MQQTLPTAEAPTYLTSAQFSLPVDPPQHALRYQILPPRHIHRKTCSRPTPPFLLSDFPQEQTCSTFLPPRHCFNTAVHPTPMNPNAPVYRRPTNIAPSPTELAQHGAVRRCSNHNGGRGTSTLVEMRRYGLPPTYCYSTNCYTNSQGHSKNHGESRISESKMQRNSDGRQGFQLHSARVEFHTEEPQSSPRLIDLPLGLG